MAYFFAFVSFGYETYNENEEVGLDRRGVMYLFF